MSTVQLTATWRSPAGPALHCYEIAGGVLRTDLPLPALHPFHRPETAPSRIEPAPLDGAGHSFYEGSGWLANEWRAVRHRHLPGGFCLEIEGIGQFQIGQKDRWISYDAQVATLPPPLLAEALLGPALILSLALQNTFTLHTSAALTPTGRLLLFAGESGRGKSTLARYLGQQPGWRRVADDILPVELAPETLSALPHFPQLKIPPERQPAIGLPQRLPVAALYLLGDPAGEIGIDPLSPQEGAFALIRHTVASRLFDQPLLTRHLDFAQKAASMIPVRRLHYPRRLDALPAVEAALAADAATLNPPLPR